MGKHKPIMVTIIVCLFLPLLRESSKTYSQVDDTDQIAFVNANNYLYLMNPDGTNVVQLTDMYGIRDPARSPDRRYLAINDNGNIGVLDVEHETVTVLTDDTYYEIHPTWSPDGERLAFFAEIEERHWEITLLNTDGTGRTAFDLPPNITGALVHNYGGLTWSPDGNYLAIVTDIGTVRDPATSFYESQQIYLVNVHDSLIEGAEVEVIHVTPHINVCPGEFYYSLAWSLETNQLAFSMSCGGGDNNIYIMDMTALEAGELPTPINLTQNCPFMWMGVVDLAWSPDGSQIAFIATDETQEAYPSQIYVLDVAAPDPCDPEVLIQLTDTPEGHSLKGLTW